MKKIVLLLVLFIAMIGTVNAQSSKSKYQGDIQLGYSFGVGNFPTDRLNVHLINSVRVNEYFSAGIGLGFDYYCNNSSELMMPFFVNFKGYLPVSQKTSLFLSTDVGYSVGVSSDMRGANGFMITPSVGSSFNVNDKNAITLSLGYNKQRLSEGGFGINMNAVTLKVGFTF